MSGPFDETRVLQLKLAAAPTILVGGSEEPRVVRRATESVLGFRGDESGLAIVPIDSSSFNISWDDSCLRLLAREELRINGRRVPAGARRIVFAGDEISVGGASVEVTAAEPDTAFRTSVGSDREADELQAEIAQARRDPTRCLQRYLLLNELGRGGFGCVYRAYDPKLERVVAVKVLLRMSGQAAKRFEREAKVTASFQHPNIVRLLDRGTHKGLPYLVMEFITGASLEGHANQVLLRLSPRERLRPTLAIIAEVAEALAHAHDRGVLHRDLKPPNILISDKGVPYVVDFGLAHQESAEERLTLTGTTLGTPLFMPLEQLVGEEIDARADVYALGATYYYLLTGTAPRLASTPAEMFEAHRKPIVPPSAFEPELPAVGDRIALRSLATDPNDRYTNMTAFAEDVRDLIAELDAPPTSASTIGFAVGGAAVTIAFGLGLYAMRPAPKPTPTPSPTVARKTTPSPTPTPTAAPAPSPRELLESARAKLERGELRQAIVELERAAAESSDLEPALALARARLRRGSKAQVEAAAREVERRGGAAEAQRVRIALALRRKDVAAARPLVARLLALPTPTVDDRVLAARIAFLSKEVKRTFAHLERALRANPDHAGAHLLRTRLFIALKKPAQAEASLARLAPIDRNPHALALRARLRLRELRPAQALDDFVKALELGPRVEGVWETLDQLRKHRSLLEPILARGLDPLISRKPDLAFARLARFLVRCDLRHSLEAAARDLDEVIRRDQEMVPRALYLRGMTRLQTQSDVAGGCADLERFLELTPEGPSNAHAREVLAKHR